MSSAPPSRRSPRIAATAAPAAAPAPSRKANPKWVDAFVEEMTRPIPAPLSPSLALRGVDAYLRTPIPGSRTVPATNPFRHIVTYTCACDCAEPHKGGGFYMIEHCRRDFATRTDTTIYKFVSDEETKKNREECERLAKEEEIKRLQTLEAIQKLPFNKCLVVENQPIYDALLAKAKEPATEDKLGFRRAAKFVRTVDASLFVEDELIFSSEVYEDIASGQAANFIDTFVSAHKRGE